MRTKHKSRGFTLVEVMIAASISLMILATIFSATLMLMKTSTVALDEADATIANVAIDAQIKRDLHGVTRIYERNDAFFHFQTTDPFENDKEIYYKFDQTDGIKLIRNDVTNEDVDEILLSDSTDGLEKVEFAYYNQRGEEVSTIAETNAMQFTIERSIEGRSATLDRGLTVTMIMFRNKIYNLDNQ